MSKPRTVYISYSWTKSLSERYVPDAPDVEYHDAKLVVWRECPPDGPQPCGECLRCLVEHVTDDAKDMHARLKKAEKRISELTAQREAAVAAWNARLREAIDALRECNICHGQGVFMDRDSLGEMRPRGCWCAAMKESKIKSNPTSSGVQNERTEAVSKKPSAAGGHIIQQKRSLK